MKAVVQRVSRAKVTVENETVGSIEKGLLILLGIERQESREKVNWMANKILKLRIFQDEHGKMNRSVQDVDGEILVVSQFTLYGNVEKGTRPSFIQAAPPEEAEPVYEQMLEVLREKSNCKVEGGRFGAMMDVSLLNDGPVTLILEK